VRKILLLNTLAKKNCAIAGCKAAFLGEVLLAGVKTPPGFVLTVSVFDEIIRKNKLLPLIKAGNLSVVREKILNSVLPLSIEKELQLAFRALGAEKVAVRSSSPFEDTLKNSAAGQFDSFLNVGEKELIETVKKVWASTFSDRAAAYAKHNFTDINKFSMAVLIQKMATGTAAGVAFSVHPVTLDEKFMVIEACKGSGEKLVEGKVNPERFTVQKSNLAVMENGFMASTEKLVGAAVSDAELKRIASHVICLENHFGFYTDTEWALEAGELYFLQCRPCTSVKPAANKADVWSNVNIAEVLPGQNYPLVVSFCSKTVDRALKRSAGIPAGIEILRGIKGRLYFNLSAIEGHFRNNLGMTNFSAALLFGGEKTKTQGVSGVKFKYKLKLFKLGAGLLLSSIALQGWLKRFTKKIPEETRDLLLKTERAGTLEELVSLKKILIAGFREDIAKSFNALIIPLLWLDLYHKAAKKWLRNVEERHLLLSGDFEGVEIFLGFKALWEIARRLKSKEILAQKFLAAVNTAAAEAVVNEEPEIHALYKEFIETQGYRCVKEIDFSQPRWSEDRSFIIDNLKNYIKAGESLDPASIEQALLVKRQELAEKLKKELPAWKVSLLLLLAEKARKGQNARETVKSSLIRIFVPLRKVLIKTALLLKTEKLLQEENDIYFLLDEEFDALSFDTTPLGHISGRKLEYLKNRDIYLPDVITDLDLLIGKGQYEPSPDIKEMQGLAISRGKIIGIARVILRAEDIGELLPGEVLVTDHTDPGWTPAFVTISALVTNTGGLLSHASIVAREYGLPAVVNVKDAVKIIKTGDKLEVDGNNGTVKIL